MATYKNHTLVILSGNCDGYGRQFAAWVKKTYPKIEIDYRPNTSGIGGGLFDEEGFPVETDTLWEDFCRSN